MQILNKTNEIAFFSLRTPQMRAFHLSWIAFFLSFFAWFGIAPLMAIVREDLSLSKEQIGNTIIASVAITIFARLLIGPMCDRFGPRRVYAALLTIGSIPVMGIGLADTYEAFLIARLAIGAIGASFVVTQFHTSMMFAPNIIGTANATSAGWGNMGGGITQMLMPLVLAGIVGLGVDQFLGWRLAMVVPGVLLFFMGIAYFLFTQDAPDGDFVDLRREEDASDVDSDKKSALGSVAKDYRVWALFIIYAGCFGVELTINNIAALYYHDKFTLDFKTAGLIAGLFGLMNLFARSMGGIFSDRLAKKFGLTGRVAMLGGALMLEGIALTVFSQMNQLGAAVASMVVFALLVQMASGATFSIVPFINQKAVGTVAGIVGAGGNVGAVAFGFLIRSPAIDFQTALLYLGMVVIGISLFATTVRFSPEAHAAEREAYRLAISGGTEAVAN